MLGDDLVRESRRHLVFQPYPQACGIMQQDMAIFVQLMRFLQGEVLLEINLGQLWKTVNMHPLKP